MIARLPQPRALLLCVMLAAGCGSEQGGNDPSTWVCEPTSPSLSDPFVLERAPTSENVALAKAVADRYVQEHPPTDQYWDWGEATLMFSLVDLYRVTGEGRYRDYYQAWIDHHVERGYLVTMSDRCPPALAAIALYQQTCEPKYRKVVDDVLLYLYETAPRTEHGGISHMGTVTIFGETLWLDSLFMFGNVFVRWGELTGNERALSEFASQYRIFQGLLQQEGGLFTHAWGWPGYQDEGVFWARGNAWVTAAGFEYLRVLALRGASDDAVEGSLRRQVEAIVASQDAATGLWWTVMSHPGEIYLETSASALFALGMARGHRLGLLDASVLPSIQRAIAGVKTKITRDETGRPIVTDISGPTTVGQLKDYAAVPLQDDLSYGVGAVILALVETSGL
jgi:unsaturated rhamnogalacturonyl hydrolase